MRKSLVAACSIFLFALAGCQTTSTTRTGEGALIGGLLGAAAGGIVGHQSNHGAEGAAIGAAAGALTGALVGSQIKKTEASTAGQTTNVSSNNNQMSLQQIADLSKQGINENVIIDRIYLTNSKFSLTPADIEYLQKEGVSPKVIEAMQGAR